MEIGMNDYSPLITSAYSIDEQKVHNVDGQSLRSQGDTVSISAEAFALAKQKYIDQSEIDEVLLEEKKNIFTALKDAKFTTSSSTSETSEEDEEAAISRKKFGEYMYTPDGRSRNGSSDSGDIEKQIKALESKIETLQGQLGKLNESGTSDLGVEGQAEGIYKNIEAIAALISELREQQSKQSKVPEVSAIAQK